MRRICEKLSVLLVVFSATTLLCGCMDTVNTTENTEKSMQRDFVRTKRVVTDGYLDKRLQVVRTDSTILPDGLMQAQVSLKSTRTGFWDWLTKGDSPYKIAYRFTWFDSGGMEVDTATNTWLEKDVLPGDMVYISSVAPNERCRDFVLRIRELE